jgi:hypothetical protein
VDSFSRSHHQPPVTLAVEGFFMKQSELSNFLEIKDGNILLPIDKYVFVLSPKAAGNMVVALRGALRLLTKRAIDVYPQSPSKNKSRKASRG